MIAARDTPADARRRKRARRRQREDKAFLAHAATYPCCITGERDVELHHEPPKSMGGGADWSDTKVVPLAPRLHRERHEIGLEAFEAKHGVVLADVIAELQATYGVGR